MQQQPVQQQEQAEYVQATVQPDSAGMSKKDKNLRLAAFIIIILACIGTAVNGVSSCLNMYFEYRPDGAIVMTALFAAVFFVIRVFLATRIYQIYQGTRPNTTGFAVADLILGAQIDGILLLISKKDK